MNIDTINDVLNRFDFIEFSIIFGSFAEGKENKMSDIDIGIFVNREYDLIELGTAITQIEAKFGKNIDMIILNDIYKKDPQFAYEVILKGRVLNSEKNDKYIMFKESVFKYYMDTNYLRDQVNKSFRLRLKNGKFGERNYA
ncbi:MAG: nucleotidyltransferase domain-containing protein [Candidatus Altarchaeum sp.]|nr:nucleotidyltransferase domain-containing protein [Candidatus Altarchaeum sp.]